MKPKPHQHLTLRHPREPRRAPPNAPTRSWWLIKPTEAQIAFYDRAKTEAERMNAVSTNFTKTDQS